MPLNINGRMKVKTLRSDFKTEFGLTLRVYDGKSFADDDATLASIRKGEKKGGEFSPRKNTKIGNLEDKFIELFGIKTQVSGSDDSYLCNNDLTLAGAYTEDLKKIERKENKNIQSIQGEMDSDENSIDEEVECSLRGVEMTIYTSKVKITEIDTQEKLASYLEDFVTNGAENNRMSYMIYDQIETFEDSDSSEINYLAKDCGNFISPVSSDEVIFYFQYFYETADWVVNVKNILDNVILNTKLFNHKNIIQTFNQNDQELSACGNCASDKSGLEIGFIVFEQDGNIVYSGNDLEDNLNDYDEVESFDLLAEALMTEMKAYELL